MNCERFVELVLGFERFLTLDSKKNFFFERSPDATLLIRREARRRSSGQTGVEPQLGDGICSGKPRDDWLGLSPFFTFGIDQEVTQSLAVAEASYYGRHC